MSNHEAETNKYLKEAETQDSSDVPERVQTLRSRPALDRRVEAALAGPGNGWRCDQQDSLEKRQNAKTRWLCLTAHVSPSVPSEGFQAITGKALS